MTIANRGALIPINGHKVSGRELRRKLNAQDQWLGEQVGPAINQLLANDRVSQQRITTLETRIATAETRITSAETMTFWQRVCWFVRGIHAS